MSYTESDVEHQDHGDHGRYIIKLEGDDFAEMTWQRLNAKAIAIDHTIVPPSYRGQGIAEALVKKGIADAQANGTKIQPICSYVQVQFRRHPEWADLRA